MTCITLHRVRQRVKPAVRLTDRGPLQRPTNEGTPGQLTGGASFKVLLVLVMAMTMLGGLLDDRGLGGSGLQHRRFDCCPTSKPEEPSPTPTAQTDIQPVRSIHFGADLC